MDKDVEARAERIRDFFNEEYLPGVHSAPPTAEYRVANALEYLAYQAGAIRKDISAIRELMERAADK